MSSVEWCSIPAGFDSRKKRYVNYVLKIEFKQLGLIQIEIILLGSGCGLLGALEQL